MNDKPLLPQHDPQRERREENLVKMRAQYLWNHDAVKPLALYSEGPGFCADLRRNWASKGIAETLRDLKNTLLLGGEYLAGRAASGVEIAASFLTGQDGQAEVFTSVDQYAQLLDDEDRPGCLDTWSRDTEFAYQRLAGVNPLSICRIDAVPGNFAITDERLAGLLGAGNTLDAEARAGRLYLCDYSILEGLEPVTDESGTRRVLPVLALFHVDAKKTGGPRLMPLAVQLGLDPRPSAVYTPHDGKAWMMAKICAQCADAAYHEMGPHLLGTHLMEETFFLAFIRTIAEDHPVYKLLSPHFNALVDNNLLGRELLISKGGSVDALMGGTLETSLSILKRTYEGYPCRGVSPWSFEDWDLPRSLAARGVSEIPDYPYRDDGLLVWRAIEGFVAAYLKGYYASDADVASDSEIQAWVREVTDPEGGHVRGVPGALESIAALVNFLTRLLFACGPLHSALNYSQYDAMLFVPNMPLALYATPPDDARALSDDALTDLLMKLLPPRDKACSQVQTIKALTAKRFGRLGYYEDGCFTDPPALEAVAAFQRELAAVEAEIEQRNVDRQLRGIRAYRYLLPSQITPATNM